MQHYIHAIDQMNRTIGLGCSWLLLIMMLNNTLVVLLRYGFNIGWVGLQEALIYEHALVLLLMAPFALRQNQHVRVDLLYSKQSSRAKQWINITGTLVLLWPFCGTVFWLALPYVATSWQVMEGSSEAGGLPILFLLKSLLLVFPVLLALQGLSELLKAISAAKDEPSHA